MHGADLFCDAGGELAELDHGGEQVGHLVARLAADGQAEVLDDAVQAGADGRITDAVELRHLLERPRGQNKLHDEVEIVLLETEQRMIAAGVNPRQIYGRACGSAAAGIPAWT